MKNKKLMGIGIALIACMAFAFAAGVYFASVSVDVTVNEALSTATATCTITGYAGETRTCEITVDNAANVPLNVALAWTETANVNGVSYSNDLPKTVELSPGANTVVVNYNIADDSENGAFAGTVSLTRTA